MGFRPPPAQSGSGAILAWATGTAYAQGQTVTNSGHTYTANDAHTAGATFAGDLAGHWTLLPVTKADVGLSNVDNTSDANKPVSTAQATADALKLAKASNLSDLVNAGTARTNLGLGTAAVAALSTDGTLGGNSDSNLPSEKAVRQYVGVSPYPSSLASGVTLAKPFDVSAGLYNFTPQAFAKTRRRIMEALAGTGSLKIAIYGHSIVNNTGASDAAHGWVSRLRTLLQAQLGDAGDGMVSLVGGNGYGPGPLGMGSYQNLSSVSLTKTADRFRLWAARDPSGGTITPSIDAAAQSAIDCNGSAAWLPTDYTFTQGSHAITFATTGFPTQGGIEVRRNGGIGCQVWGYGVNGGEMSQIVDNSHPPTGPLGSLPVVGAPDLVIFMDLINAWKNSTAVATTQADYATAIAACRAAGIDVIATVDPAADPAQQTGTAIPLSSYSASVYANADTYNCGVVDIQHRWGNWSTANANGLMTDEFHPNDVGHYDIAASVYYALQRLGVGL